MKHVITAVLLMSISCCNAGFMPQKISDTDEQPHMLPTEAWGAKIVEYDVPQKKIVVSGDSEEDGFSKIYSGLEVALIIPYQDDDSFDQALSNAVAYLNKQKLTHLNMKVERHKNLSAEFNDSRLRAKVNAAAEFLMKNVINSSIVIAPEITTFSGSLGYDFRNSTGAEAVFILKYTQV